MSTSLDPALLVTSSTFSCFPDLDQAPTGRGDTIVHAGTWPGERLELHFIYSLTSGNRISDPPTSPIQHDNPVFFPPILLSSLAITSILSNASTTLFASLASPKVQIVAGFSTGRWFLVHRIGVRVQYVGVDARSAAFGTHRHMCSSVGI